MYMVLLVRLSKVELAHENFVSSAPDEKSVLRNRDDAESNENSVEVYILHYING